MFKDKLLEEQDNLILWIPIFFAVGVIFKFNYTANYYIYWILIVLFLAIYIIQKKISYLLLYILFILFGLLRTEIFLYNKNKNVVLNNFIGLAKIYGKIESEKISLTHEDDYKKEIIMEIDKIVKIKTGEKIKNIPKKLLIRLKNYEQKVFLSKAVVEANIFPLKDKKFASDFDYKKHLQYQNIGGVGYKGVIIKNKNDEKLTIKQKIDNLRYKMAMKIISYRDSGSMRVIATLLTGQKNLVDKYTLKSMNYSGLSHLLAISGLHMMILIASVFCIIKWLLLRSEIIAIHCNVNKIATVFSLIFNFIYLLLSGCSISAIRAYIMSVFLLISILIGRFNDSMRSVFFVMLLMVFINPNVIFNVGFQLSFISVMSIISSVKYYNEKIKIKNTAVVKNKFVIACYNYFVLSFIISLVAEMANTPFTIYYFNNYTFYNVFTNLLAGPLISLIVLPFTMLSMVLYFLGLEYFTVIPASYAMDIVLKISNFVLSIDNAIIILESPCNLVMFLMIWGILIFTIFKTNIKHIGILLYGMGLLFFLFQKSPDVVIDYNDKTLFFIKNKKEIFVYNANKYTINNSLLKLGKNDYVDITDAYKNKKYLIFYNKGKEIKIDLKNFSFYGENYKLKKINNKFYYVFL